MALEEAHAASVDAGEPGRVAQLRPTKVAVVVTSMHRSGTSAMTRVLNLLGCEGAKSIMPADKHNEKGYWESEDFTALNDAALSSAGADWTSWEPLNASWYASPIYASFRERAVEALERQFGRSSLIVLKDPRIARLLPLWLDALKQFGAQSKIVIPVREPVEVAESLLHRNGTNTSVAQLMWLRYMLDAEVYSRKLPRAFVSYDALLSDWRATMNAVSSSIDVALPRSSTSVASDINTFLQKSLKHYSIGTQRVVTAEAFSPWVQNVHSLLEGWASGAHDPADESELDRIRLAFDEAARTFALPLHQYHDHATYLTSKLDDKEQTLGDRDRELRTAADALDQLQRTLDGQRSERSDLVRHVEDLHANLTAVRGALTEKETALGRASEQSAFAHRILNEAKAAMRLMMEERQELEADVARVNALEAEVARLEAIEGSTVWRATRVVRARLARHPQAAGTLRRMLRFVYRLARGR